MTASPDPLLVEAEQVLWNTRFAADDPDASGLLMQQYLHYLDMADRISERRASANSFFLSLNTGVVTAYAAVAEFAGVPSSALVQAALAALILLCVTWAWLLRSYRTLNRGKFAVVGMLEKRLPASPFDAEWVSLGKSSDWRRHTSLSPIETVVPALFVAIYLWLWWSVPSG